MAERGKMKILKAGKPVKSWSKECVCTGKGNKSGGCRALLLVEKTDLFQTYRSYMGREEEIFVTFCCPICGVDTDIQPPPFNPRDLPDHKTWQKNNKVQESLG
jgi:hypothetical protein